MRHIITSLIVFVLPIMAFADVWDDLAKYEYGDASNAAELADQLIQKTPVAEHGALEDKLIAVISSADASTTGKAFACRLLQQVGTNKAIPALAALLQHAELAHYARLPLERMENARADAAMRDALKMAPDDAKAGLAGSLGVRRDGASVEALSALSKHQRQDIAIASLHALGKIGNAAAIKFLKSASFEGLVKTAHMEALVSAGHAASRVDAVGVYDKLFSEGKTAHRTAALKGLITVDPDRAGTLILEAVRGDDAGMRQSALGLAADAKHGAMTHQLVAALPSLGTAQQADVIASVGRSGDRSVIPKLTGFLNSDDAGVRAASAGALGRLGNGATARLLLGMSDTPGVVEVITTMAAADVDSALVDALRDNDLRSSAIKMLIARGSKNAAPRLLQLTGDGSADVRKEAWRGLASLGGENDMAGMMKSAMSYKSDNEIGTALATVKRIAAQAGDKNKTFDVIAGYYGDASSSVKGRLLDIAAVVGNDSALDLQRKALASGDEELYGKALRALANWSNASAADDLGKIAQNSKNDTDKILALRGYIRLAGLSESRLSGGERTAMFKNAIGMAERPEEKRLIIGGLRNAGTPEALEIIKPFLKDEALKTDAELSAADLVWNLRATKSEAVVALANQLASSENATVSKKARDTLADLSKADAYVKAWMVSGPYREKDKDGNAVFKTAYPPEKDPGSAKWSNLTKGVGKEVINLEAAVGGGDHYGAYLKTNIHSPSAQEVRFEMGSDDGIKVWLNDKVVHSNMTSRGCTPGQDVVKVQLNKGANKLMVKVVDLSSHYSVSFRIMNDQGAVPGLKFVP